MRRLVLKEIKDFNLLICKKRNNNFFIKCDLQIDNLTQAKIIGYLGENKDKNINQKDIEEYMGFNRATISSVLDILEKRNIITRILDSSDARKKNIKLTEKSLKAFKKIVNAIEEIDKIVTDNISKEELDIFFEVLDKMKDNIRKDDENV